MFLMLGLLFYIKPGEAFDPCCPSCYQFFTTNSQNVTYNTKQAIITYIVQVRDVQKELRIRVGNANIVYYEDKRWQN